MLMTIQKAEIFRFDMQTRMPFRYGIAAMTELPHILVRVTLELDGQRQTGLAADHLPPKWFTKNPNTTFAEDIEEMLTVIRVACTLTEDVPPAATVFDLWRELYAYQASWALEEAYPPLLWGFGLSLVERALIDAYCRHSGQTFVEVLHTNSLGIELGELHPELAGSTPADFLPSQPAPYLTVRHTVGLSDPLTDADIPPAEQLDDGLPQSLAACIQTYGLTHFKLKLHGDPAQDVSRLTQIARVIEDHCSGDYAFTLDGNENYQTVEPFQALWTQLQAQPGLTSFMAHLLLVEQPLHRDVALSEATAAAFRRWADRPAIIIDESDGEIDSLPEALAAGYSGTSHKNCKGVFKGITHACLIAWLRQQNPAGIYILSGEDLSTVGPVALLQDCTVMAALGVPHAERNGHHYFAGLSMFSESVQMAMLAHHPDLYQRHPRGFPAVKIEGGQIAIGSLLSAPFGLAIDLDMADFTVVEI